MTSFTSPRVDLVAREGLGDGGLDVRSSAPRVAPARGRASTPAIAPPFLPMVGLILDDCTSVHPSRCTWARLAVMPTPPMSAAVALDAILVPPGASS
jgi:hypothetical protein